MQLSNELLTWCHDTITKVRSRHDTYFTTNRMLGRVFAKSPAFCRPASISAVVVSSGCASSALGSPGKVDCVRTMLQSDTKRKQKHHSTRLHVLHNESHARSCLREFAGLLQTGEHRRSGSLERLRFLSIWIAGKYVHVEHFCFLCDTKRRRCGNSCDVCAYSTEYRATKRLISKNDKFKNKFASAALHLRRHTLHCILGTHSTASFF